MGEHDVIPDANAPSQAVNVVINGQGSSVQITTAQAAGINPTASATGCQTLPALLARLEEAFRAQGTGETLKPSEPAGLLITDSDWREAADYRERVPLPPVTARC